MDLSKIYRTESPDYKEVWENLVAGVKDYLDEFGIQSMILGVSGGIDSTVVAAICCEVSKRTGKKLIGMSLMTPTNANDEIESALAVGHEFCNHYSVTYMDKEFEILNRMCEEVNGPNDSFSSGNIKARMRMLTLFDASAKNKGIVMGGSNLTEVLLGFFTIGGDNISALAPLGSLWKHEVYGLARWIKDNIYPESAALEKAIAIIPTDGNGVVAGGDLAQIAPGATYEIVDDILMRYIYTKYQYREKYGTVEYDEATSKCWDRCRELYGEEVTSQVIHRYINTEFKRFHSPVYVDAFEFRGISKDMSGNIIVNHCLEAEENTTNKD